ncbi:MAG: hypothetical protein ACT4NJ_07715 [Nitrosopumilaceae archaeon]
MEEIKTEWKILCSSHRACPTVMDELKNIGFHKVKDTPNSPTSDISAILVVTDEQKIQQTAKTLLDKHRSDIQRISVTYF